MLGEAVKERDAVVRNDIRVLQMTKLGKKKQRTSECFFVFVVDTGKVL